MHFSVILDCTPEISHKEHMSLAIRYVSDRVNVEKPVAVHECFIKFLSVESSTGQDHDLCDVLVNELEKLELNVQNIRGQGYDNGANMKGVHSLVQKRLLNIDSRTFFLHPCACHNYNPVVAYMAKTCPDALTFLKNYTTRVHHLLSIYKEMVTIQKECFQSISETSVRNKLGMWNRYCQSTSLSIA